MGLEPSGLFDTHPSNGDRIRRARLAQEPGVFQLDGPATTLFANFEVLAKQVSVLHFSDDLGLPVGMATFYSPRPAPAADQTGSALATEPVAVPAGTEAPRLRVRLRS